VQNVVPARPQGSLALRSLAERHDAYVEEVERLVRAGLAVMRRRGTLDPRVSEIVAEANLSNQAFYRHFHGKDELLLAILDDGLGQLVDYLEHRMAKERTGIGKVRTWVEGVLAQAANAEAAEATRPFALNGLRLSHEFPEEVRRSEALLTVGNPAGLRVEREVRICQMVFFLLDAPVAGYAGAYQGENLTGC